MPFQQPLFLGKNRQAHGQKRAPPVCQLSNHDRARQGKANTQTIPGGRYKSFRQYVQARDANIPHADNPGGRHPYRKPPTRTPPRQRGRDIFQRQTIRRGLERFYSHLDFHSLADDSCLPKRTKKRHSKIAHRCQVWDRYSLQERCFGIGNLCTTRTYEGRANAKAAPHLAPS